MRNNDIINSSYTIGVGTRNMVLNTLGRLYVKVQDRYYEIDFRNLSNGSNSTPDVITINSTNDIENLAYPGDDKLIISEDGALWITKNGEFKLIELKVNQDELVVNNLTVNGQITVTAKEDEKTPPFIITSKELVENLNVQYLNGYESKDFAIKSKNETITGTWQFKNAKVSGNITSPYGGLNLDFNNNKISVCELDVTCNATFPEGFFPEDNGDVGNYSGFKNRTYFGREFKADSFELIDAYTQDLKSIIKLAYKIQYLENYIETAEGGKELFEEDWYDIFLNYDEETSEYIPIDIENNKTDANDKLTAMGINNKTIDDYSLVWKNINAINSSDYLGYVYNVTIPNFEYVEFGTILPGDDVILNVTGKRAKVLEINENGIIIKLKEADFEISTDIKVIQLPKNGSTYIQSSGADVPYLDVIDNNSVLKARIGNLEGLRLTYADKVGVFLQNPYIYSDLVRIKNNGGQITNSFIWNDSGECYYKPNYINKTLIERGTQDLTKHNIISATINATTSRPPNPLILQVNVGTILELYISDTSISDLTIQNVDNNIELRINTAHYGNSWLLLFVGQRKIFQLNFNENF